MRALTVCEALNGTLHAFVLVTEERALADARAAEARCHGGQGGGPLCGMPIGHKDIYDTAGIRRPCHSRMLQRQRSGHATRPVRVKLAGAGSVLMGKLATHEFADGRAVVRSAVAAGAQSVGHGAFHRGLVIGTGAGVRRA